MIKLVINFVYKVTNHINIKKPITKVDKAFRKKLK